MTLSKGLPRQHNTALASKSLHPRQRPKYGSVLLRKK